MNDPIFLDFLFDREREIYERTKSNYGSVYDGVISIIEKSNEAERNKRRLASSN